MPDDTVSGRVAETYSGLEVPRLIAAAQPPDGPPIPTRHGQAARRADRAGDAADWILGAVGGLIAVMVPVVVLALPGATVVAVVGAPGADPAESARIIAEAGGTILDRGGPDNVLVARSDRDGFAGRLYAAGARLVLDGRKTAGCDPSAARIASPIPPPETRRTLPR